MPEIHEPNTIYLLPITGHRGGKYKQVVAYAVVLDDPFTRTVLMKQSWSFRSDRGYPHTHERLPAGRRKRVSLHQIVYEHYHGSLPPGAEIDHIDRNPLNCLPSNLRVATDSVQKANQKVPANNSSGFKGVTWSAYHGKWKAKIQANLQRIHLGYFTCPREAARAVNAAYRTHFPEVALPNPEVETTR